MSIKKNNTYFEKNNGKVYYIDEGVKTDVPSSAFGNLDDKISTKLDTSAFSDVSGTFYTTDNPSGFIDKSVDDLTNYYTTAQTYTQAEINEMLANFGGFEVVELTTGTNPHPDVSNPSTKIIYLTRATTAQVSDPYSEWIYTSADAQTTAWECIGETTPDLSKYQTTAAMSSYYTKSETSGANELTTEFAKYVQTATTGSWDVTEYSGTNGVNVAGHEVGLSSDYKAAIESISSDYQTIAGMTAYQPSGNYMSANALDSISGTWNEVSAKVDTSAIFDGSDPGLVPSAAPADSAKALRGDGTWGDVSNVNVSYSADIEELHLDFSIGGN